MEYFRIYDSAMEQLKELSAEQIGHVILAASAYSNGEELPELDAFERIVFIRLRQTIDCDAKAYNETCAKNKLNGSKGGAPKGNNNARKNNQNNRAVDLETTKTTQTTQTTQTSQYKDEYEYKDENKNNSLSLSLSPSESRESESGEDIGGVSAADRERIFEILFFRNFKNPQKEVERLIDHYSAVGWRRHGDIRAVNDKTALAKGWTPENKEQGIGKFQPDVLVKLQAIYTEIKAESPEDASTIIRGTYGFDEMPDLFRIKCISKATADAYERHCAIIKANNLTNGKRLSYGVLKK